MTAYRRLPGIALTWLVVAGCSDASDEAGALRAPSTGLTPTSVITVDPGSACVYRAGRIWLTRDLDQFDVPEVRRVQRWLNARRYGVVVDGIYGPQTEGAVARFQSDRWLDVNGNVGPKTYSMLRRE